MSGREKKQRQSFLHGAVILAAATAVVKVIGALYKIPLGNLLDGVGMSYFYVAYDIYNVLLVLSTAGLPVALSKMVAESAAHGRATEVKKTFSVAMLAFCVIGLLGGLLMFFFAKPLAEMMGNPEAWYAIRVFAPAVFFVSLISVYRGYFQGLANMMPTAVSQVLEALCKLIVGFGLAMWLTGAGHGQEIASAGAIAGVMLGTLLSAIYLMLRKSFSQGRELDGMTSTQSSSRRDLMIRLARLAIPVTLGSAVLSLTNFIDTMLVLNRLQGAAGLSLERAKFLYGSYGNAKTLFNLPTAFIIPLAVSVIPAISDALARRQSERAGRIAESSLRISSILALPAGAGLAILSGPILNLLYFERPEEAAAAAPLLTTLAISVVFVCLVSLTNAILQAMDMVSIPIITMTVGGVVKIALNWFLVGNPDINIGGAPIGTTACYAIISILNLFIISRVSKSPPKFVRIFLRPLIATVVMAGAVWASFGLLERFVGERIGALAAIAVGVAVYLVVLVLIRGITREDLLLLPKGEKIAHFLKIE